MKINPKKFQVVIYGKKNGVKRNRCFFKMEPNSSSTLAVKWHAAIYPEIVFLFWHIAL